MITISNTFILLIFVWTGFWELWSISQKWIYSLNFLGVIERREYIIINWIVEINYHNIYIKKKVFAEIRMIFRRFQSHKKSNLSTLWCGTFVEKNQPADNSNKTFGLDDIFVMTCKFFRLSARSSHREKGRR